MIRQPIFDADISEWRESAACLHSPSALFFGFDETEAPLERRAREDEAKQVCLGCCVRHDCLEYALRSKEPYGIWGGMTEIERRAHIHGRLR